MKGSEHADAVLDRVLAARPFIEEIARRAGRGRFVRVYQYLSRGSLQVLYVAPKKGVDEALEVGLAFDSTSAPENLENMTEYREQLGKNEKKLGLTLRDPGKSAAVYLTKRFPLGKDPASAYDDAAELCVNLLDLALGGRGVSEGYRRRRETYLKAHPAAAVAGAVG